MPQSKQGLSLDSLLFLYYFVLSLPTKKKCHEDYRIYPPFVGGSETHRAIDIDSVRRVCHRHSHAFVQGEYALLTGMYLQNIGMFILPAWFAAMLFWGNAGRGLRLNKAPRLLELLCIVILYFVATPMFNRLVEWNESINLPEAFASIEAWMRQQEEAAATVTEQLMQIHSLPHFLAVVLVSVFSPAWARRWCSGAYSNRWFRVKAVELM